MTAMDELKKLLSERGFEYFNGRHGTYWDKGDKFAYSFSASELSDGTLRVVLHRITPEQAVAATLGSGTCKMRQHMWMPMWTCSECGKTNGGVIGADRHEPPIVCPNCGKAVKR